MAEPKPIIQNTFHLAVAAVLRKLVVLVYFVIVARYAGLNVTGLFYLVICYGALFSAVVDLGLTNIFIRDASREPDRLEELLSRTLSLKVVLAVVAMASIAALLQALEYPTITNRLIYIVVVTVVLESFATTFFGCYRVHRDMRPEAVGMVVGGATTLMLGAAAVGLELSPYFLILAITLDTLVNFVMGWFVVTRWLKVRIRLALLASVSWDRITVGIPFALSALFVQVYAFDAVVLQRFMGETFVALYSVTARPVGAVQFVPLMLAVTLFPTFSRLYRLNRSALGLTLLQSHYLLLMASVPIVVLAVAGAEDIISLIFGPQYSSSVGPFRVMALSLVPIFLIAPTLALLNACNAQVTAALNVAAALVAHVTLSVWLIPQHGVIGAAIASTLSASGLAALCWYTAHRLVGTPLRSHVGQVIKVGLAAVAMSGLLAVSRETLPFMAMVVPSVLVYLTSIFLVEGVDRRGFRLSTARSRVQTLVDMLFQSPADLDTAVEGRPSSQTADHDPSEASRE